MGDGNGNGGMHRRVEWMVPADTSILRFMAAVTDERGNPAIQTPKTIALNTGYSNRHVAKRCRTLSDYGLLERARADSSAGGRGRVSRRSRRPGMRDSRTRRDTVYPKV